MTNLERITMSTPTELAHSVFMFPRVSSRDLPGGHPWALPLLPLHGRSRL